MAVISFWLADDYEIRFWKVCEGRDAWCLFVAGFREDGVEYVRVSSEPWVDDYCKSRGLSRSWRKLEDRLEGEEEGRIVVQVLDRQRHVGHAP